MKKTITILFLVFTAMISYAHDVEIEGIYYNLDYEAKEAVVTFKGEKYHEYWNEYVDSAIIPATISVDDVTYSVTSIGYGAFYGCYGLTSVTIPNSVTSIGGSAFVQCSGLTSVEIPNSVTSIGKQAFEECSELTCVTIPNSVTSIGEDAFYGCSGLSSVTIPNSITRIESFAFWGCTSLTSMTIPNSVTSIGDEAFGGCFGLTSVNIPNSVTSIGVYAFTDCYSLTSITIPYSVTSIGEAAFWGCSGLKEIYSLNTTPPSIALNYTFSGVDKTNTVIYVPEGSLDAYKTAYGWKDFSNILQIQEDVEKTASDFRTTYSDILEKSTATVTSDDLDNINKAINDYENLSDAAKDKLKIEKNLLDFLKEKAENLKATEEADAAATAEANKFKTDNADILNKVADNVTSSDLDAINKALDDYNNLSDDAKDKLKKRERRP